MRHVSPDELNEHLRPYCGADDDERDARILGEFGADFTIGPDMSSSTSSAPSIGSD